MKNAVFQYEIWSWFRSPFYYLPAITYFGFSLVTTLGTGGFFDGPAPAAENAPLLNAPYALSSFSFLLTKLLLFVAALFGGYSLYRDYRNRTHAILYTFPISGPFYLKGKLGSALFMLLVVSLLAFSGIWTGELVLGAAHPRIGSGMRFGYLLAFGLYQLPTLMVAGVFAFVAVGISRNVFSGFIVVICLVLWQLILENVPFFHEAGPALLDPFGQHAFHLATRDWDFQMQNSRALPVDPMVIANRVFWLLLAFSSYRLFLGKFDFQYEAMGAFQRKGRRRKSADPELSESLAGDPKIRYDFSPAARITCCLQLMIGDFRRIVTSRLFLALCFFGGLTVFFIQLKVSNTGPVNLLPLTRLFIGAPLSLYTLIIILSTFLFSGWLAHQAKQYRMHLMVDATAVLGWQLLLSKMGAIGLMQVVQLLLFLSIGVAIQLFNGHYELEIGLYLFHLFVLVLPVLLVWNITSQFVHALTPNLFMGLFLLSGLWLGAQSLEQIGITTHTLKYNTPFPLEYSAFNGYGHALEAYCLLLVYWLLFGVFLLLGALLIRSRGSLSSPKERLALARSRITQPLVRLMALSIALFLGLGGYIYKSEMADKNALASDPVRTLKAYQEGWEQYGRLPQPLITDVALQIDLYPEKRSFEATGTYRLVNRSGERIDTLFIRTGFDEITELDWRGRARLLKADPVLKSYLYELTAPLAPGDSIELCFTIRNVPNTMFTRNSGVLANGSFIRQDILPRLGYQFVDHELPLTDSLVNRHHYFNRDAAYVHISTAISTAGDQVAIAPGELIAATKEAGRNRYEYRTPAPVKFNFSFHSATFELLEAQHEGVALQLYFPTGHASNTRLMLEGLRAALDYNSRWFGPYPYRQVRVVAFPHTEAGYAATLFANNVASSETLFNFKAGRSDATIHLPFYVMAHELTHEWFGNQVMPADAEGARMLTESITEYLSLCIYEARFGAASADRFLDVQHQRYQRGRKEERGAERPLSRVLSHQEYIAYGKGAIAFRKLSKAIGQEKLNALLRQYLLKYRSRSDYYPTTKDFIQLLKMNTDAAQHPLIDQWLTQVNLI